MSTVTHQPGVLVPGTAWGPPQVHNVMFLQPASLGKDAESHAPHPLGLLGHLAWSLLPPCSDPRQCAVGQ